MLADNIKKIYLGGSEVQKMYLGENLIYPREPADEYLMLGTTTGTNDFMIGSSTSITGSPDCIKVHVVQEPGGKKFAKKVLKEKESKNKEHGIYEELGEDKASFYSYEEDEDYDNVVFSYEGKAFPGGVVITIVLVLCVVLILLFFPDLKQLIVG